MNYSSYMLTAFVFLQQKCARLEQKKVQLTENCKGLLRRAKTTCKMQADESLPEDLRNVSVYYIACLYHVVHLLLWRPFEHNIFNIIL